MAVLGHMMRFDERAILTDYADYAASLAMRMAFWAPVLGEAQAKLFDFLAAASRAAIRSTADCFTRVIEVSIVPCTGTSRGTLMSSTL